MNFSIKVRRWHRWLALLIGLQMLLWVASGLYMTAVPIEYIHGDHLVRPVDASLPATGLVPLAIVAERVDGVRSVRLKPFLGSPVFEVTHTAGFDLFDARNGTKLTPLSEQQARALAALYYAGNEPIRTVEWLDEAPAEVGGRKPPLWRVTYEAPTDPTLYFSAATGELVAKRHRWWRTFDFLWMLHIMDYEAREDTNNWLLRSASVVASVLALSGLWLMFPGLRRRLRSAR